jgi:hypothetical protein
MHKLGMRCSAVLYLAQPGQQQQLEWIDGGNLAIMLDGAATAGQLMMGRDGPGRLTPPAAPTTPGTLTKENDR